MTSVTAQKQTEITAAMVNAFIAAAWKHAPYQLSDPAIRDGLLAAWNTRPPAGEPAQQPITCAHEWGNVDSDGSVWPMEDAICKNCGQRKGRTAP